jgi:hypothetical protein
MKLVAALMLFCAICAPVLGQEIVRGVFEVLYFGFVLCIFSMVLFLLCCLTVVCYDDFPYRAALADA